MRRIELGERPPHRKDLGRWYAGVLEQQARSGLSMAEYADQLGVTATTLYQWRRRLAGRGEGQTPGRRSRNGLVEVVIQRGAAAATVDGFVVRLGRDRSIEVPPGFDAPELSRLVDLLESC